MTHLYPLIYLGLNPKGISKAAKGLSSIFFVFYKSKLNAFKSISFPSIVTLTIIDYLNGFLNLICPDLSLFKAPEIDWISKSFGG